ncbi:MAG: hypothetical protein CVV04_12050 [Firmicutes bacterium HGW-Firmicutes-9]|jgi:hypothetical protein|nr:MAG: hypothetical protein CVV04_12050 [Firmicutes bacterium HGW-Firmicutes-9]
MAEIKSYPNNVDVEIGAENVMKWHHGRRTGVYGAERELAVAALEPPEMAVTVSDGDGWMTDAIGNGIHFWNDLFAATAALLRLSIDTADGVLNRIDRVIVEWSTPNYTQLPEIKVLKGVAAMVPIAPSLTNNASLRQISLSRVSVAAGTLAITAGMITDERFDPTVCGIVTESTVVDTSVAAAQFNEVLEEAQNLVLQLEEEAVVDHSGTHEPGGDDVARFVFYGGEQVLTDTEKAQARSNVSAEAARLQFINTVVDNAAFVADATYADFPFRAAVALTGVLATMVPFVVFGAVDAVSGIFAPVADPFDGGVYLYAAEVPAADITVPTMIFWR